MTKLLSARPRPFKSRKQGHTLLELVIAIGSTSVLLIGLASTLVIANRTATAPLLSRDTIESSSLARQLLQELSGARKIISHTSTQVTFLAGDVDGDGVLDQIHYELDGETLIRQVNQGDKVSLSERVQKFDLTLESSLRHTEFPLTEVVAAEALFGATDDTIPASKTLSSDLVSKDAKLIGQSFAASDFGNSVPSDALWWRLDALHVYMNAGSAHPNMWLRLQRGSGDDRPNSYPLSNSLTAAEATATKSGHIRCAFRLAEPIFQLQRTERLAFVIPDLDGFQPLTDSAPTRQFRSQDGGGSWQIENQGVTFVATGAYTKPSAVKSTDRYYWERARVSLRVGGQGNAHLSAATSFEKRPLDHKAQWQARFDTNPLLIDENGDNVADWSANAFDATQLAQGTWMAPAHAATISTAPSSSFTGDVEVHLICQSLQAHSSGVVLELPLHRTGTKSQRVQLHVGSGTNQRQTLRIITGESNLRTIVRDLPERLLHIRLTSAAELGKFAVWIDDRYVGTFDHETINSAQSSASISVRGASAIDLLEVTEF